jgi:predicted ArsR family transcriptional regulator
MLMSGASATDVANSLGVTDRTIRNWRASEDWQRVKQLIEASSLEEYYGLALTSLRTLLTTGDAQTVRWFLERARPDLFGQQRTALSATVKDGDRTVVIELTPG